MDLFRLTDQKIFNKLGKYAFIRNGVGYDWIFNDFLYDNGFLEIGLGRSTSGYGDWGGGSSHSTTSPLKLTIDKNYKIHKIETDSFYNSESSQAYQKIAQSFIKRRLAVGKTFHVRDEFLKKCIDETFKMLPCKYYIGIDVFDIYPSQLNNYIVKTPEWRLRDSLYNNPDKE